MRKLVWFLLIALMFLHHDFWFWNDGTLIGGVAPIGLVYHAGISIAAAIVWWLAVQYAWPNLASEDSLPADSAASTEGPAA